MRALIASLIAVLALSIVPEAAAKTYSAERFDSRIQILELSTRPAAAGCATRSGASGSAVRMAPPAATNAQKIGAAPV